MMNPTKTYIAAAAVVIVIAIMLGTVLWSEHKLAKLESELSESEANAEAAERRSREMEAAAAEHKQKIDYLEASLSDLKRIAAKQDENIKLLETDSDGARRGADRARRVERIESTTAELCRKLAELGHPCD